MRWLLVCGLWLVASSAVAQSDRVERDRARRVGELRLERRQLARRHAGVVEAPNAVLLGAGIVEIAALVVPSFVVGGGFVGCFGAPASDDACAVMNATAAWIAPYGAVIGAVAGATMIGATVAIIVIRFDDLPTRKRMYQIDRELRWVDVRVSLAPTAVQIAIRF